MVARGGGAAAGFIPGGDRGLPKARVVLFGGGAGSGGTHVYHYAAGLHVGAWSSVYTSIHGVSGWAFVRVDLMRSYLHIHFMSNHFVSLITAHQLVLVDVFSL
jgi:hypothetical protein